MNIHDKIDLLSRWIETPEETLTSDENLGILREVIDYASASPNKYETVSSSNFQICVEEILGEIESYNAPLTRLLGPYSRQVIQEDKGTVIRELEEAEQKARSRYERDIIRGFRQGIAAN